MGNLISRLRNEIRFSKQQGYSRYTRVYNVVWLTVDSFTSKPVRDRIMSAFRVVTRGTTSEA